MTARAPANAAQRGVPSLVWRAGQERRLHMIRQAAPAGLKGRGRILVDGCGVGLYVDKLRQLTPHVFGLDVEFGHVAAAARTLDRLVVAAGERLPYPDECFDLVLSHEVIEHMQDDRAAATEMARVLRPGGRIVLFCPNRWYPVETHGVYWRGRYHFGNIPLVNYLPNRWRNRLAPHVRTYTAGDLRRLFAGLRLRRLSHARIFGGYDNLVARLGWAGRVIRALLHAAEHTPLRLLGLSHFLVLERVD